MHGVEWNFPCLFFFGERARAQIRYQHYKKVLKETKSTIRSSGNPPSSPSRTCRWSAENAVPRHCRNRRVISTQAAGKSPNSAEKRRQRGSRRIHGSEEKAMMDRTTHPCSPCRLRHPRKEQKRTANCNHDPSHEFAEIRRPPPPGGRYSPPPSPLPELKPWTAETLTKQT